MMDEKTAKTDYFHRLSGEWMETASTFWDNSFKLQNELTESLPSMWNLYSDSFSKSGQTVNIYNSINKFLLSFFSKPENLQAFSKSSEMLPMLVMNMSQNLMKIFTEIQHKIIESSTLFDKEIKEVNADELKTSIFSIWKKMYESDFQKFFNVPQLGIARNYQEELNLTLDTGNRAFIAFTEFMNLVYIPVEKAGGVVMEKYREMVEKDEIPEDPKTIYKIWIKTLEGFYMEMLKSPEYSKALHALINTIAEHKESKGKIVNSMLQQLQIPTNTELDELYKEIYILKKRLRELEKKTQPTTNSTPVELKVSKESETTDLKEPVKATKETKKTQALSAEKTNTPKKTDTTKTIPASKTAKISKAAATKQSKTKK